jgi:hypothetical protein
MNTNPTTIHEIQQTILKRVDRLLNSDITQSVGSEVANLSHAYNRLEDAGSARPVNHPR